MARVEVVALGASGLRLVRPTEAGLRPRSASEVAGRRNLTMLMGATAFLTAGGLIMVLSASSVSAYAQYGSSFLFFQRQAAYAVVGTVALVVTSRMRYDAWQRLAVPFLGLTVVLLALVLHPTAGIEAYGSSRWISLGPVTIQPSELAKLALVVFVATVLARKWSRMDEPTHFALPLLPVTVLVCGMVIVQPDLGTAVILAGSVFLLLFAAGVRLRYLGAAGIVGGAIGFALIMG